jgi:hypothetical protein
MLEGLGVIKNGVNVTAFSSDAAAVYCFFADRRYCPVGSMISPAAEINEPIVQTGFILLPRHAVYSTLKPYSEARKSCREVN